MRQRQRTGPARGHRQVVALVMDDDYDGTVPAPVVAVVVVVEA